MGSSASISNPTNNNQLYYPRNPSDALSALTILSQKLPTEISLQILEHAKYWVANRVSRTEQVTYTQHDPASHDPYLRSLPIEGTRFPVREIRIQIQSHDQGWSSYPKDRGTLRNSWTWFELGVEHASDREAETGVSSERDRIKDRRLVTNVHASKSARENVVIYRAGVENEQDDDSGVGDGLSVRELGELARLQAGDCVSIIPRARFAGWTNFVCSASIEIYTMDL
ncbi:hypothetical protein N7474_002776 [Penicillium riverlandense]|uniref:uncharacterized protein n=1 Tax=Penicillium riverlandense TaxID=1903569 RepID=UPI002546E273|nr:uncharacterized protein N7474_002776 [Penicillium riverlandense]KAJ5825638.1 hypothetical protein N7474_002776 [Penicillium riverlandense]